MPGMNPNNVSNILSQKWPLKPISIKTPNGGKIMANIILIGSVAVTGMVCTPNHRA